MRKFLAFMLPFLFFSNVLAREEKIRIENINFENIITRYEGEKSSIGMGIDEKNTSLALRFSGSKDCEGSFVISNGDIKGLETKISLGRFVFDIGRIERRIEKFEKKESLLQISCSNKSNEKSNEHSNFAFGFAVKNDEIEPIGYFYNCKKYFFGIGKGTENFLQLGKKGIYIKIKLEDGKLDVGIRKGKKFDEKVFINSLVQRWTGIENVIFTNLLKNPLTPRWLYIEEGGKGLNYKLPKFENMKFEAAYNFEKFWIGIVNEEKKKIKIKPEGGIKYKGINLRIVPKKYIIEADISP